MRGGGGHPAWPNEKSAKAFSLRLNGLTYAAIAKELGCSRSAVSGYLARHGVKGGSDNCYLTRGYVRRCGEGYEFQVPDRRPNDDRKHLRLMLAALREARAA